LVASYKFRQRRLLVLLQGIITITITITTTATYIPPTTTTTVTYRAIHCLCITGSIQQGGATSYPYCWPVAASGYSITTKWRSLSRGGKTSII